MSKVKALTTDEIMDMISMVAPSTMVVGDEFVIVSDWSDVEAIEGVTGLGIGEVVKVITKDDCNWGFSDEYTICGCCYNVIKTSPDSYGWIPDYHVFSSGIVCGDCIRNESGDYLLEIINDPKKANTILEDEQLRENGFIKLDHEYEAGWYGSYDNPQSIFKNIEAKYGEVVFSITSQGQFHTNFNCWVRSPKYNFPDYMEEINVDRFKASIEKNINELNNNLKEYGYRIPIATLISGRAGQYINGEFLELIGLSSEDIIKAEEGDYIYHTVIENMIQLSDDLKLYCDFNDIDLKNHNIYVDFNDVDGDVDVFLSIDCE